MREGRSFQGHGDLSLVKREPVRVGEAGGTGEAAQFFRGNQNSSME